jgi:hypothetical protein
MENTENTQEWYEGTDAEIDFNELNKAHNILRYSNTVINNN